MNESVHLPQRLPLAARLADIQARITRAAQACHRANDTVVLVAVTKTYPVDDVQSAMACGHYVFGENRVQEAAAKFPLPRDDPRIRLHLIGSLQTNKALDAVALADVIESLDRPSLANALSRAADRVGRMPALLVQVNVGDEPQKSGVSRAAADGFIDGIHRRFGSDLQGLMCVPPVGIDPTPYFRWLASCATRHGLSKLSMGMSSDFEVAIACGATIVRVGSAIFGLRLQNHPATA